MSAEPTTEPTTEEPIVAELADLVFQVAGRLSAEFNAAAAELDLPPAQAMALSTLCEPVPMRRLADRLHCDASNVTGIVDGLERRGLVTRRPAPHDRRVKHLVLTEEGTRRRALLLERGQAEAAALFAFPDTDRRRLRDLLARALETGA
ncbi:MarR family winged helix-turn-helix transcriptional regulator [Spirillospora sp. CA-253888]